MTSFDRAIATLDVGLFDTIETQTGANDRRALLACQAGIRDPRGEYTYLEIGSHLGGSLQPHVLDPRCRHITSIDSRPPVQPDERGVDFAYAGNSTARMMDAVGRLSVEGAAKITCIETDTAEIDADTITPRPDLCFIDGEHTDRAVVRDFTFCRTVLAPNGAIVLHDANVIHTGLAEIIRTLEYASVRFRAYHLPDVVFVIAFDDCALHETPAIREMLVDNHVGYLASLAANDHYRRFANKPVFQLIRKVRRRFTA